MFVKGVLHHLQPGGRKSFKLGLTSKIKDNRTALTQNELKYYLLDIPYFLMKSMVLYKFVDKRLRWQMGGRWREV